MTVNGLEVFDSTIHKTHIWLNDIKQTMGWEDDHAAYRALRATLHALRDRLTVEEAAGLGAQLPMLIRGMYYEGWRPAGKPDRSVDYEGLLARVDAAFSGDASADPETIARAAFAALARHVDRGVIDQVAHQLPKSLRSLWHEAVGA